MAFSMLHCFCTDGHVTATLNQELSAVTGASVSTSVKRAGNVSSLQHTNGFGQDCWLPFPSTLGTWIFACSLRIPSLNTSILSPRNTSIQFTVAVNASGGISVTVRDGPTYSSAANGLVSANTWFWIAIKTTLHGSAGYLEVAVNGVNCILQSGVQTSQYGTTTTAMILNGPWGSAVNMGGYMVGTGDVPADTIIADFPLSASSNQFTPTGAATALDCIDDASPNGDTDYNISSTTGHRDLFTVGAVPTDVAGAVHGVQVVLFASTDVASRGLKAICKVGGSELLSSSNGVNVGYTSRGSNVFTTNPATGAAWGNVSNVPGALVGYELQA